MRGEGRRKRGVVAGFLFLGGASALMMGNAGGRASVAGHGSTGAPGENGKVCLTCHNGGAYGPIIELLEVTTAGGQLVASYTPGQTYDVKMTVFQNAGDPAGYGFQLTALDAKNANAGVFKNLSNNVKESVANQVGNRKYLEHKGVSPGGVFTAKWTAPAAKTGAVTMYYVGNVVNGNGAKTGDNGGLGSSITLTEGGLGGLPLPYFDDFELGPGGWTASDVPALPVASWRWGLAQPATLGDPEAWGASGGAGAGPGGLALLESVPLDFSGYVVDPIVWFGVHYDTDGQSGAWLELSIDGGATWDKVGGQGEGQGWYDGFSPLHGDWWSGDSGGWSAAEHALDGTAGLVDVRLRFVFTRGTASSLDGIGIDDFGIDPDPEEPDPPGGGGSSSGGDGYGDGSGSSGGGSDGDKESTGSTGSGGSSGG